MRHIPVLLNEIIESLQIKSGMNVVDCTLGDGGHAQAILEKIGPKGKLLGIDADAESILRAKRFLYNFGDRVIYARENFLNLKSIIEKNNFFPVNAILMDLGWSMPQFMERERGFSFEKDEPLDMRYDIASGQKTAKDILNQYDKEELANIFKIYGEEKLYVEIASAVVEFRKDKLMERTGELTEVILSVYRKKLRTDKEVPWIGGIHPATKVFQALRIAVNSELETLRQALPQAVESLAPGGRLAVISFHSLEDRIVKQYFRSINGRQSNGVEFKIINKKPIIAGEEELAINFSARSAKLRVIEKI